MREREAAEPDGQQDDSGAGESVRGFGWRRPARQRRDDRRSGRRPRRPPGGDHGGHDREDHRRRDRPPLQVESADPVIDEALEAGRERNPGRETQDGSGHGADDADDRSVGDHREANLAVGRAERAQHAERPEPALGHDGETRGGNEADEQETDGLQREDDHRGRRSCSAVERVPMPTVLPFGRNASSCRPEASNRIVT